MSQKLIVLMIDGVSADYYRTEGGRLPNLKSLESRGFRVDSLHAEVLGTSLPGRTSMMTGVTADVSGIYGNKIWDPKRGTFRYSNPDDVRVPTLHARAKAAGKTVANIGFGMIRPEDTNIFRAPWWAGAFIQRARDAAPEEADASWTRVALHPTEQTFIDACHTAGVPDTLPVIDMESDAQRAFFGVMADHTMLDWVGVLATGKTPPDLIVAEFLVTDTIQHETGYKSELSHWAIMQADMAVGKVLARLRAAGLEDEWHIAVMSDHGHSTVEKALHPQVIIPGVTFQTEGQIIMVAPKDHAELDDISARLAAYDVEPYPNTCLPPEYRDQVYLFIAPDGYSFEADNADETEVAGTARTTSSHGLRPGLPGDDRFALFAGPTVPTGIVSEANAVQVMPTLASILGIAVEGLAHPIFDTKRVTS
jgi:predicted AlkP superfamily pyrophosphatase or phosphodiesterase